MARSRDGAKAAVADALSPYRWRSFTERMLARWAVGAVDHHRVREFVAALPGAVPGVDAPVTPADPYDVRVEWLVASPLAGPWRELTLGRLAFELVESLAAWQEGYDRLEAELSRLRDAGS